MSKSFTQFMAENFKVYYDPNSNGWGEDKVIAYAKSQGYAPYAVAGVNNVSTAFVLFKLTKDDRYMINNVPMKSGEEIFRYATRQTIISGQMPLIKINTKSGNAYFLTEESSSGETDNIYFETRAGMKLRYMRVIN